MTAVIPDAPLTPTPAPVRVPTSDEATPALTASQLTRLAAQGRERGVAEGEVIVEVGETCVAFFVVLAGRLDVVYPSAAGETGVLMLEPDGR